jgi:hypothetical protein
VIDARVGAAVGAAVIDAWRHRFGGGIDRHHAVVGASRGGGGVTAGGCGGWGHLWPVGAAVGASIGGGIDRHRWELRCGDR